MYAAKTIGRRRPEGWIERRRYFRRLLELVRIKPEKMDKLPEAEPTQKKD